MSKSVCIHLSSTHVQSSQEDTDTGANASAEEAEEGVEDGAVQVNNVVNSFRLNQTSFDKKSYLSHLKGKSHN